MTVGELVAYLQSQDQDKRVVAADRDGAGPAEDIEFADQRVEKGENIIALWYHK
jgi:hypothetical protein